jgi:PhnB protein
MAKKKARKKSPAKKKTNRKKAVAKRRKVPHVPKGYHSVTPYLIVRGANAAIDFYEKVFGAKKLMAFQDGERIAHAELKLGDAHVMLADENTDMGILAPAPGQFPGVSVMLYLKDADAAVERAVAAGSKVERPVADQFYGDRLGVVVDPYGHRWFVATHIEAVSAAEMKRRMQAMKPA